MAVTAKVYCNTKTLWSSGGCQVGFTVNYADGRNKSWAASTPTLDLKMGVKDAELFKLGQAYTLTFEED